MFALSGACIALAGCDRAGSPVRASGTIEIDEIDVASLVGGRLVRLYAVEGDTVRAGDTLAVLDRGEITAQLLGSAAEAERAAALWRDQQAGPRRQELQAARAEVAGARAERRLAETEEQRLEKLARDNFASQAALDAARARREAAFAAEQVAGERLRMLELGFRKDQIAAARAAASAAQEELAAARSRAQELTLTAPMDGVVLLKNADRGELVAAGVPVLTLGDPRRLWIRVYVPAPELDRVRLGGRAEVRVHGFSRRAFPGRVVEIATSAEFTPRVALTEEERANLVFGVKIALDPSDGVLKPGLPADARIFAEPAPGPAPATPPPVRG